jgi:membrane protein
MEKKRNILWVLRHLAVLYFTENIPQAAAELSYFLLFSFCPILMFITAGFSLLNLSKDEIEMVTRFLPISVQSIIRSYMTYLAWQPRISPMLIGTVLTIYFLSRAVRSLMYKVNEIYHVRERKGMVYQVVLSLVFTCGFLLSIIGTLALVVFGRTAFRMIRKWLPVPDVVTNVVESAAMPVAMCIIFLFILLVNKLLPNIRLSWRQVLPGAALSFCSWILISVCFSFYVDNIARYSLLYGSLGAIIVLMLWLYMTCITLLMGPVLNRILLLRSAEKRKKKAEGLS